MGKKPQLFPLTWAYLKERDPFQKEPPAYWRDGMTILDVLEHPDIPPGDKSSIFHTHGVFTGTDFDRAIFNAYLYAAPRDPEGDVRNTFSRFKREACSEEEERMLNREWSEQRAKYVAECMRVAAETIRKELGL